MRQELAPQGFEIITVAMDTDRAAAAPWIAAAHPEHPSLIDTRHQVSELYGMLNVPSGVWIDEQGRVVRPSEVAYCTDTFRKLTGVDSAAYVAAIRDWVKNGASSRFAMTEDEVLRRQRPANIAQALALANFRLGEYFWQEGEQDAAISYFKESQRLEPESWNYKRQAFALAGEQPFGTTFVDEVKRLAGRPYYAPLELDAIGDEQQRASATQASVLEEIVRPEARKS